jgi:hypothetical protein
MVRDASVALAIASVALAIASVALAIASVALRGSPDEGSGERLRVTSRMF